MSMIMEFFKKVFDFLFLMEDGKYSFTSLIVGALSVIALKFYSNRYEKNKEKKENRL